MPLRSRDANHAGGRKQNAEIRGFQPQGAQRTKSGDTPAGMPALPDTATKRAAGDAMLRCESATEQEGRRGALTTPAGQNGGREAGGTRCPAMRPRKFQHYLTDPGEAWILRSEPISFLEEVVV